MCSYLLKIQIKNKLKNLIPRKCSHSELNCARNSNVFWKESEVITPNYRD